MISGTQPATAASYARVENPKPAAATQNLETDMCSKYLVVEVAVVEGYGVGGIRGRWRRECTSPYRPRGPHG